MSSINRAQRGELITVGLALQIYDKVLNIAKILTIKSYLCAVLFTILLIN